MKAAIIGMGIMGTGMGNVLQRYDDVELVAVVNRGEERRVEAEKTFDCKGYGNYETMLDNEKIDAAFIATPDWDHHDPVMACLDRGIHVYCEKPLTTRADEAAAIVRKVRETGLKLQVSYNHRWLAPYHTVYQQIRSGAIGQPLVGYARKNNPITVPTQMLASWAKDSTPMWFQTSHDIDLMTWWFDDIPVDVTCHGVKGVLKEQFGWDTYDALQGQVRYQRGGMATFDAAWIYPASHPSMPDSFMSVVGEQGHLQIDRKDETVEMSSPAGFTWPRSLLNCKVYDQWIGAFPSCIASFFDTVREGREPYVNALDGWLVTAVLEALHTSAAQDGARVKVAAPPV